MLNNYSRHICRKNFNFEIPNLWPWHLNKSQFNLDLPFNKASEPFFAFNINSVGFCVAHINHIREVAGVDSVGLGAGYDGIN